MLKKNLCTALYTKCPQHLLEFGQEDSNQQPVAAGSQGRHMNFANPHKIMDLISL